MSPKFVLTTCPFCGCGCNFYLEVIDNQIMNVIPCKTHEITEGTLCSKGRNAHKFVQIKDRLVNPLIKKNGKFVATSWDEALSFIASKLTAIKNKYGSDSIGVISSAKCTNEENYLIAKFARVALGTNNIDQCARLCHASTMVGLINAFGSGAMTNSIPELERSDCILVTGSDTIEQHPLIGSRILRAKENGAKLIVVDPRAVPIAKFADVYLQPSPGTDVAWLNGFMNVIINESLQAEDFIARRTEGYDGLRKIVERYTPEEVEKITGIPHQKLLEAARAYAKAERSAIVFSMGITQHTTGTDNVAAIANLAMLTGNVGKESTGVNPLRGQNNVQGACDVGALPDFYSGYQKVDDATVRKKFETEWKTKLPSVPGLTVVEMLNEAANNGKIKALYIVGENPMLSDPDINKVKKGLKKLEFLVVQDIFMSETAKLADVVLPAASFAEKEGTFTATDRRVQRVRKAIEPVGNSKPDWQIVCELAKKLGANGFNYESPEAVMKEIARLTPIYGGISYERLDKGEQLLWPCPNESHPGTKYLHAEKFARGKGLFIPVEYKPPAEEADAEYPFVLTTGRIIFHYHTGTMTRKIDLLHNEVPTGFIEINPENAKKLGVKTGERVIVKSRRGEIRIKTLVTNRVAKGVVFIPFHFAECRANILTNAALDPKAKIPELKVCAVKIIKPKEKRRKNEY